MHQAESHYITVLDLTSFGNSSSARSVDHSHQAVCRRWGDLHIGFNALVEVAGEQHLAMVKLHKRKQLLIGDEQFGARILNHKLQSLGGIGRIQRLIGATSLKYTYGGNGHPLAARNQNGHHVLATQTFGS